MTLTAPPTAPSSSSPSTFEARADALVAWFATFVSEANILAAAMDAAAAGGVFSLGYTFSTTTTDADPGAGYLRLNNATQNAATVLRVDLTDLSGNDQTNALDLFNDSTSAICGFIKLFKFSDPTKYLIFSVTSVASPSGYRNVTGACVAYSAASPFSNGDQIELEFTRTGDKGDTGATGPAVSLASPGPIGNTTPSTLAATTGSFSGALTYGGVTLSNSVTGTGSMVLSASPTFTGTTNFANQTVSGAISFGSAVNGDYINSGLHQINVALNNVGVGTFTSTGFQGAIGATTPSTGAFTTLAASGVTQITNATATNSQATGALIVTGGVGIGGDLRFGQNLVQNAAAGTGRYHYWQTSTSSRWTAGATADAESSGNAGTNFSIARYSDAGSFIDHSIYITRSTNGAAFGGLLDLSGAAAGQIKFPATQNASSNVNTLDDYERGTWSGGFTLGGGSNGMSVSVGGSYVKIGRAVTQILDFQLTTKGSSTGTALLTGALMFTPPAGYGAGVTVNSGVNMTFTGVLALNKWNTTGTTGLEPHALSNGGQTALTDTAFANGSEFHTEFSYISAA